MSYAWIVLCFALVLPSLQQQDDKALLGMMKEAEIVVVAEVAEVYPSPGFWSGTFASVQHVKYRVVEVLKGEVKKKEIDAGHYVVSNGLTADKENARLSPKIFSPGNRLILILSRERGHGCKLNKREDDVETFCAPNENGGATIAESGLVDKIRSGLKGE
jgi:hypothetical protein